MDAYTEEELIYFTSLDELKAYFAAKGNPGRQMCGTFVRGAGLLYPYRQKPVYQKQDADDKGFCQDWRNLLYH